MMIGLLALMAAAIFFGAAFYVNVVEQAAHLQLDDRALLSEWKPSYKRGAAMQAPLAVIGFVLGPIAWWQTSRAAFLVGAVAMIAPWPWTSIAIKPVNDALMASNVEMANAQSRSLIVKWGGLHATRTVFGAIATIAFFWACLSR
jgi:hypothetical protein